MLALHDALFGSLLGTAVGDALGLPAEGLTPRMIARRFGALDRYSLLGRVGFVSDDTEQSLLVLQSLIVARGDARIAAMCFRRSLVGWFWRLPFGIGLATLRACLRATVGFSRTGIASAGNGAAMRSPVIGVFLRDAEVTEVAREIACVTHTDERADQAAMFVAGFASQLARGTPTADAARLALESVTQLELRNAIATALELAASETPDEECARRLGSDGFVLHSIPWSVCCAVRHHASPMNAIRVAIRGGGDTDTNAAMVGAWLGALHGPSAFPRELVDALVGGPFGVAHARALVEAAVASRARGETRVPGYAWPLALVRIVALFPVVLAHGFRRLWPW